VVGLLIFDPVVEGEEVVGTPSFGGNFEYRELLLAKS
jgi:hypothetical protein